MAYSVDTIRGIVDVGCTMLGVQPFGAYGDGMMCRIEFAITEAGESEIALFDTVLLDTNLDEIGHQTRDGYFDGFNTELVMINIGARSMHVGETKVFEVKVNHEDPSGEPLNVFARIDNVRVEDGRTTTLFSGQHYAYPPIREPIDLYVDGYTAERQQWTEVGDSPFLAAPDDGNEIVGSSNGAQHRWFTFEDIDLGSDVVDEVRLWVYCEGPATELVDYDVYAPGFNWLGSYYGEGVGNRVWQDVPRWAGGAIASEMYPDLLTEEGINGFEALCYYYDPDGVGVGNDIIDAMYLEITFLADRVALPLSNEIYMVQPGDNRWLDTIDVTDETVGTLAQNHIEGGVAIGTSDDVTTAFSFECEDYGAITEGSEVVYVGGVETTDYSIVYDGAAATINFTTAPVKVPEVQTVTGEHVGTGDNVTTVFSLGDTPIVDTTVVYVDGIETNATYWPNTVDHEAATITFATAPQNLSYTGTVEGAYVGTGDGETRTFSFESLDPQPDEGTMVVYVNDSMAFPAVNYEAMTIKFGGGPHIPAEGADITVDYEYTYWVAMVITADYDHIVIVGQPITVDFEWVDQTLTFELRNIGPIDAGTDVVYLNGVVTTDYSIDYEAGIITFPALPSELNVHITADYTYDTEATVWPLQPEDVGTYVCTVTVYYSYGGFFYNPARKHVITEHWRCDPAK
jgi:hypothetical protein